MPITAETCIVAPVTTSTASTTAVTPATNAAGPNVCRRHGPSRAIATISASIARISTARASTGGCVRHHGNKLARNEERSEEHTSELQSRFDLVCRLLLE